MQRFSKNSIFEIPAISEVVVVVAIFVFVAIAASPEQLAATDCKNFADQVAEIDTSVVVAGLADFVPGGTPYSNIVAVVSKNADVGVEN